MYLLGVTYVSVLVLIGSGCNCSQGYVQLYSLSTLDLLIIGRCDVSSLLDCGTHTQERDNHVAPRYYVYRPVHIHLLMLMLMLTLVY